MWYVQGHIIRLSESLTASFRMELKNNALSQASYKESVSAATVDRTISWMSSTIEELYFYFCQMEIMMFETNFTVFRMDGGARDIILCITFSGEEPRGANTNSKTHLWNNQLPQKAVITNIQNFIQKTSFTHLQNENPAQNNSQLPPENKNLLINDTFFNATSFFSLMLGFFQVI